MKEGEGIPEEEFASLLSGISRAAPLFEGLRGVLPGLFKGGGAPPCPAGEKSPSARRNAVLLAVSPYLSEKRQEAISLMVRFSRVADALHGLK